MGSSTAEPLNTLEELATLELLGALPPLLMMGMSVPDVVQVCAALGAAGAPRGIVAASGGARS